MSEDPGDPFGDLDDEGDDPLAGGDGDEDDPFADLEDDVDVDVDELFTEMDVGDIDEDSVWEEVVGEDGAEAGAGATTDAGVGAATPGPEATPADAAGSPFGAGVDETVVRKERYCQGCEYFAPPPEVACRNEGTEILELVDIDRYRVRNCPVVARRQGAAEDILPDEE